MMLAMCDGETREMGIAVLADAELLHLQMQILTASGSFLFC